jgi:hypothetical protein
MVAGLNFRINVWRINYNPDDAIGGAVITGTLVYTDLQARMQANRDVQALLQQGLETDRTFNLVLIPGTLDVRERDEIEVCQPIEHQYYGRRFRIRSVSYSDHNPRDPRNYLMITVSRSVTSHAEQ